MRKILNMLSTGMQLAVDEGRTPANRASRLKMPTQSKRHKKLLEDRQVAELVAAVDAKPLGEGLGLLVLVLACCGLRWREFTALRVRDLDSVRGRLDVHTTMIEVGGYMEESRPKDHMFVSSKSGSMMRNCTFRRGWFNNAAQEIGLAGLTPHELRHTCASLAMLAGASTNALRRVLSYRPAGSRPGIGATMRA